MIDEIKRRLKEYEINTITQSNFTQVMEIYNTNQDFFLLTENKEVQLEECIRDIGAVPPNFDIGKKIYISIWKNGKIVGVLDLLTGYPTQCCIWIGLLLIHGELHGKNIGSRIMTAVFEASKAVGYESIQLGVIENNIAGINFWHKHGFEKIRESKMEQDNIKAINITVMEKRMA